MADYAVKFHYDYHGRDTHTAACKDWLTAKASFDDYCRNMHNAPEIKKVEMLVRGKVEHSAIRQ